MKSITLKKFYNHLVTLNNLHTKEQAVVQKFEPNGIGTDFVCGDIHNQWDKLENQLKNIGFNKKNVKTM